MSRSFNGSSQYLQADQTLLTDMPITMACWGNSNSNTGAQDAMCISDKSTNNDEYRLQWSGNVAGDPIRATIKNTVTYAAATSSGYSINTWHHGCAVFASSTSRTVYIDGGSAGSNTSSQAPNSANIDSVGVGALIRATPSAYFSGELRCASVWNVALTAAEVALLATGIDSRRVRPANLIFYYPLVGRYSPEIDLISGTGLTVTGATYSAVEPRLYSAKRSRIFIASASSGPTIINRTVSSSLSLSDAPNKQLNLNRVDDLSLIDSIIVSLIGAATVFEDAFTEGGIFDVDLENHTPTVGVEWELLSGGAGSAQIDPSDDQLFANNNSDAVYLSDPLSGGDRFSVEAELANVSGTAHDESYVCVVIQDASNFIGWRSDGGDIVVAKKVGGTVTDLFSVSATAGHTYKLQKFGNNYELFDDGVSVGSANTSDLNSLQRQGLFISNSSLTAWIDNYKAQAGGSGTISVSALDDLALTEIRYRLLSLVRNEAIELSEVVSSGKHRYGTVINSINLSDDQFKSLIKGAYGASTLVVIDNRYLFLNRVTSDLCELTDKHILEYQLSKLLRDELDISSYIYVNYFVTKHLTSLVTLTDVLNLAYAKSVRFIDYVDVYDNILAKISGTLNRIVLENLTLSEAITRSTDRFTNIESVGVVDYEHKAVHRLFINTLEAIDREFKTKLNTAFNSLGITDNETKTLYINKLTNTATSDQLAVSISVYRQLETLIPELITDSVTKHIGAFRVDFIDLMTGIDATYLSAGQGLLLILLSLANLPIELKVFERVIGGGVSEANIDLKVSGGL